MTNEQIDGLDGQDLRKAVASSLGWVRLPFPAIPNWQRPTDKGTEVALSIPDWPADISAAWSLVEELRKSGWYFLLHDETNEWTVMLGRPEWTTGDLAKARVLLQAKGKTVPAAICRAFLKSQND